MLIIVGAVVLGLAVSAGLLFGVILPRFERDPESGPTFAPGELTPEESTVMAVPQPDGTVRVDQVLIFDIVPGLEDRPATWDLGGTRIGWKSADRTAQYGVIPEVVALEAREVPVADAPVPLKITVDESDYEDPFFDGRRYELIAPALVAGPAPGRVQLRARRRLGRGRRRSPAGAAAAVRQRTRQQSAARPGPPPGARRGPPGVPRHQRHLQRTADAAATAAG